MKALDGGAAQLRGQWLALEAGRVGAVHEARKLCRRMQAQLRAADAPRATRAAWKEVRRAVASLRDHDAAGALLLQALRDLRVPEVEVRAFRRGWQAGRQWLVAGLHLPPVPPAAHAPEHWKRRLRRAAGRLAPELQERAALAFSTADPGAWHRLRKGLKQYRYLTEPLGPVPRTLLQLLDNLGRVQDAEVVAAVVRSGAVPVPHGEAVLAHEAQAQLAAQARLRARWPAFSATLLRAELDD